jgi:hypothetical protein
MELKLKQALKCLFFCSMQLKVENEDFKVKITQFSKKKW